GMEHRSVPACHRTGKPSDVGWQAKLEVISLDGLKKHLAAHHQDLVVQAGQQVRGLEKQMVDLSSILQAMNDERYRGTPRRQSTSQTQGQDCAGANRAKTNSEGLVPLDWR